MSLTVCFITNRREPRFEWFFDSLTRQRNEDLKLIVVSPYMSEWSFSCGGSAPGRLDARSTVPKPCVWSGPHRLTSRDYFSAANSRNTAAALCKTEWLAICDDLSVLGPEWLAAVRDAMAGNYIALGCYQKVRKLVVKDGVAESFEDLEAGHDTRLKALEGLPGNVFPVEGGWMYGCSFALPLDALFTINGFSENLCDSLGGEDVMAGVVLQNCGYKFKLDRRMFTLESEEDHHIETPALRWDPGISPNDMSHKALDIALKSKRFENDFGDGLDLRGLHERMMNGGTFPIRTTPENHWFTGTALKDL